MLWQIVAMAYRNTCSKLHITVNRCTVLLLFVLIAALPMHQIAADPKVNLDTQVSSMLLADPSWEDVTQFLNEHFEPILTDETTVIKAVILARNAHNYDLALKIANSAISKGLRSERLFYEIGLVYLVTGNCFNASMIFETILRGDAALKKGQSITWMVSEMQQALKLCNVSNVWIYDNDIAFGYSDNLAQVTPARKVRPEDGSLYGQYLTALREIFPNLPAEITIGQKPKSGITATTNHYLDKHHYYDGSYYGIHLNGSLTATLPTGYEEARLNLGLSRQIKFSDIHLSNHLSTYFQKHEQGRGNGHSYSEGIRLINTATYLAPFRPTIVVVNGAHRSKTNQRQSYKSSEIKLQLRHRATNKDWPWKIEVGRGKNRYANQQFSSNSKFVSVGLTRFKLSDHAMLSIDISEKVTSPAHPRPWYKDRHKSGERSLSLTYHGALFKRDIDITASWKNTYISNQNADHENFTLSFRINRVWR